MRATYELLKILKMLGVAALFSGTIGALLPRSLDDRRRAAYLLAGPGFGITWIGGFGIAIVSTSRGVMTGEKAKKLSIGGELLCEIW